MQRAARWTRDRDRTHQPAHALPLRRAACAPPSAPRPQKAAYRADDRPADHRAPHLTEAPTTGRAQRLVHATRFRRARQPVAIAADEPRQAFHAEPLAARTLVLVASEPPLGLGRERVGGDVEAVRAERQLGATHRVRAHHGRTIDRILASRALVVFGHAESMIDFSWKSS